VQALSVGVGALLGFGSVGVGACNRHVHSSLSGVVVAAPHEQGSAHPYSFRAPLVQMQLLLLGFGEGVDGGLMARLCGGCSSS
jgi:hypothetical protein